MELLELKHKVLELFDTDIDHLGNALMSAVTNNDTTKYDAFCELVNGDLTVDWLQMVYQYYHADRTEKMQDYTPRSIADLMGRLAGRSDIIIDMCAGSGALAIQRWAQEPEQKFRLIEIDENVIPFLLFNLAVRNIDSSVCKKDVLSDGTGQQWRVSRGDNYGRVTCIKSTV